MVLRRQTMRTFQKLFTLLLSSTFLIGCLAACKEPTENEPTPIEGLEFTLSDEGTYYICSGIKRTDSGETDGDTLKIPDKHEGLLVREIGEGAFEGLNIKEIIFPVMIEKIGKNAFNGCRGIEELILPDALHTIDEYAFQNCDGIRSVTFPNGMTSIGDYAFDNCRGMTSVTLPTTLKEIGNGTFESCNELTAIDFPSSLQKIGDDAFRNCAFTELRLNTGLEWIGDFAFCNSEITQIFLPETLVYLGQGVFPDELYEENEYGNLEYLPSKNNPYFAAIQVKAHDIYDCTLHPNTEIIAAHAFENSFRLQEIVLPASVKGIGDRAFYDCHALETIRIADGQRWQLTYAHQLPELTEESILLLNNTNNDDHFTSHLIKSHIDYAWKKIV